MSDMKYGVSLQFKQALADLKKFKTEVQKFQNIQVKNTARQVAMQRNLNNMKAKDTVFAKRMVQDQKDYDKVQQGITKRLGKEERERLRVIDSSAKAAHKARQQAEGVDSARRKQSVAGITQSTGLKAKDSTFAQQLKQEDQLARQKDSANKRNEKSLQQAKDTVSRSVFMMKAFSKETTNAADKAQMITQAQIRTRIATAKTATEVRNIVAQEKAKLEFSKRSTAEMKKQNFLMQRMRNSSQQFAGNMVSAFAVAAGGAAVTRIGQEFEAVDNTMLAVSESSKQAGENFQFVKDEAFRLGLGLTESAKGFAKMVAARGDMSLIDTKAVFTGTAEMSTLLGLTADESNRATNAIQQMMSKGVVSAEEFTV